MLLLCYKKFEMFNFYNEPYLSLESLILHKVSPKDCIHRQSLGHPVDLVPSIHLTMMKHYWNVYKHKNVIMKHVHVVLINP